MPSNVSRDEAVPRPVRQPVQLGENSGRRLPVVPAHQGAAVLDLAEDHLAGDGQGGLGRHCSQVLPAAQFHVLVAHALGYAPEPPAVAEVADGNVPVAQLPERLGGDLDIAEEGKVGDFHQTDLLQHLSLLFHFQLVAGLADNGSLSLHVNGNGVIPGGNHPADVLRPDSPDPSGR